MNQIKKKETDPDYENLNPEIVQLARTNAFLKQPMEMYLTGKLTWLEALETMVLLITKEFREQQTLLVATLQEAGPQTTMLLSGQAGKLLKALPPRPLNSDEK